MTQLWRVLQYSLLFNRLSGRCAKKSNDESIISHSADYWNGCRQILLEYHCNCIVRVWH